MSQSQKGTAQEVAEIQTASEVPKMIGAFVTCLCIAWLAVILRITSRRIKRTALKTDDFLLMASLAFTTVMSGLNLGLTRDGLGRHAAFIKDPKTFALGVMIVEVVYGMDIFLIKLSWLFMLHRIFPGRCLLRLAWAIGSLVTAYTIVQIVCSVFQCVPIRALWNPQVSGRCINLDDVFVLCGSLNIATDIAIICLPMPQLWTLKVSNIRKIQLTFMFLLGGLVCIISIIRVPHMLGMSQTDPGWTFVPAAEWSSAECCVATLSACLPTMGPIYTWMMNREGQGNALERIWRRRRGDFLGSETTNNDTWALNQRAKDSNVGASIPIRLCCNPRSGKNTGMPEDLGSMEGSWYRHDAEQVTGVEDARIARICGNEHALMEVAKQGS